jgi:hypothetical protein
MPAPQKWPLNRIGGIGIEGGERERERERRREIDLLDCYGGLGLLRAMLVVALTFA